jgi:cysteine-rich repeat protein
MTTSRLVPTVLAALAMLVLAALATATPQTALAGIVGPTFNVMTPGPSATVTPSPPSHFQCYGVRRQPFAAIGGVTLADQFGTSAADVTRIRRLCNPASKNGEEPGAVTAPDHLMAFKIRRTGERFRRLRNVEVTNQFGVAEIEVRRPVMLLVPTAKSLSAPVLPPTAPAIDHYQCYDVKGGAGTRAGGVIVQDQLGTLTVDVKRPRWLCNPVDKNGEGLVDPEAHLMCYTVRAKPSFADFTGPIWFANQFRSGIIEARRPEGTKVTELCVPSVKRVQPPGCVNGVLDPGEDCDVATPIICRGSCNPFVGICTDFGCEVDCTCAPVTCGDLSFDPPDEECEDGNATSGDGCSAECLLEGALCGNGQPPCESGDYCFFQPLLCGEPDFLGICRPIPTPCTCPTVVDAVCGCDGVTYDNACEADCAGTSVRTPGACPP